MGIMDMDNESTIDRLVTENKELKNRIKELEEILSGENLERIIDCVKTHGHHLLLGMSLPESLIKKLETENSDDWNKRKQECIQKSLKEYSELIIKLKALENK